jgi:hypothetical protein
VFVTLLVSAISLKFHDSGQAEKSIKINRFGSRAVVIFYVLANIIAIGLALR